MNRKLNLSLLRSILYGILGALVAIGTHWAFTRGGKDFDVFFEAFKLVLGGWGPQIYRVSPDRFLYAPGFAYFFSPFGLLERDTALAAWCLLKALCLGLFLRKYSQKLAPQLGPWASIFTLMGVVLVAKPLLIDFTYGQINLFLVSLAGWSLLSHFDRTPAKPVRDFARWCLLAMAAVSKIFLLPTLVVPWLLTAGLVKKRIYLERAGVLAGVVLMLLAPFAVEGFWGGISLYREWHSALVARGLPMDSHNQSFGALLHHYLGGEPTPILSLGTPILLGARLLSPERIGFLTLAWTCVFIGVLAGWLVTARERPPLLWISVLLGLLIVPSHLVWKPYFVFTLPIAILFVSHVFQSRNRREWWIPAVLFVLINFTGFDFVGRSLGSRIEAASLLLLAHLFLLAWVAKRAKAPL